MCIKKISWSIGIALCSFIILNSCEKENPDENVKISFETVNGFIIKESGEKILATDNGLFLFDETTGNFDFIEGANNLKPLNDLAFSKNEISKELWLASNEGVLDFNNQQLFSSSNSGLQNNSVSHLDFDFNNRGIFATSEGLSILDNNKWTVSSGLNDIYLNFEITDLAPAVNGFVYVTTRGGGIERFKFDVDGISGATIFDTDWTRLESNNINIVYIDSITQVYGTDTGVAMHYSEFTKWDWEIYTTKNGLINNMVISVAKDKSGNWWFGTPQGLSRFNNSKWTSYTVEIQNILDNNIQFLAIDADGSVWFACDEGLSHFVNNRWINFSKYTFLNQ